MLIAAATAALSLIAFIIANNAPENSTPAIATFVVAFLVALVATIFAIIGIIRLIKWACED